SYIYTLSLHDALPIYGTIVNQQNPIIPAAVRAEHHGTYRLTVQSADGCEASANYSITVNTNPTAILPDDFEVCADDLLNFSVTRSEEHTSELQSRENL